MADEKFLSDVLARLNALEQQNKEVRSLLCLSCKELCPNVMMRRTAVWLADWCA